MSLDHDPGQYAPSIVHPTLMAVEPDRVSPNRILGRFIPFGISPSTINRPTEFCLPYNPPDYSHWKCSSTAESNRVISSVCEDGIDKCAG